MAHPEQRRFASIIAGISRAKIASGSVLEIGSHDYNGSIRPLFDNCGLKEYIGVDLMEGPGVDVVKSGHELEFEDNYFDLTISCECFEHNPHWVETFTNMIRMTKPDGIIAMSCASRGRVEHGTSRAKYSGESEGSDYYRNLTEMDFARNISLDKSFEFYKFSYNRRHRDLFFVGIKKNSSPEESKVMLNKIIIELRGIDSECRRERGVLRTLAKEVALNLPLGALSRILTEESFQHIAVPYREMLRRLAGSRGEEWFKQKRAISC